MEIQPCNSGPYSVDTRGVIMSQLFIVALCLISCVVCGYIDVDYDRVVNLIPDEDEHKSNKTLKRLEAKNNDRAIDIGGKDMLVQLAMAVMLKLYTVFPLVLGALGLIAGVTIATSKAAFLLLAAVAVYYYISEQKFWPPIAKDTGWAYYIPDLPYLNLQTLFPQQPYQHQPLYEDHLHQPRIVLRRVENT